jgi:hypothetical protein
MYMMERKDYIAKIEDLTAEQIVEGIFGGIVTFDELKKTGEFGSDKQKTVKALLKKRDDDAFAAANTVEALENYLHVFPGGNHTAEANEQIRKIHEEDRVRIREIEERDRMLREVRNDINEYTPGEIIDKLSDDVLDDLCYELGLDAKMIKNYSEPTLNFNDIPQNESDIPAGYTDVFFWGIPSSGKTCALSAIFSTIKKDYSMEAPDCTRKFGATYRDSLVNIFRNDCGYLPGRTNQDRTQYMPFLFYKRGEKDKRRISFFELSGEVFKYFYEEANNSQIVDDYDRENIEKSFQTLKLLLKSNNQKIHFFFIDYNQETKHTADNNGLTQSNYLEAAATYFRDNNEIFKKKTDAVYVIVTKSDEIRSDDKTSSAKSFLNDNFGSFMDVLRNQCRKHSVDFRVKLFSIGDVYFKRICKINRAYSTDIINDLLNRVKPASDSKFKKFFNS